MSESIPHLHDADCICGDCWYPTGPSADPTAEPLAQWELELLAEDARRAAEDGAA